MLKKVEVYQELNHTGNEPEPEIETEIDYFRIDSCLFRIDSQVSEKYAKNMTKYWHDTPEVII